MELLPAEVLMNILKYLPVQDLKSMTMMSMRFNSITRDILMAASKVVILPRNVERIEEILDRIVIAEFRDFGGAGTDSRTWSRAMTDLLNEALWKLLRGVNVCELRLVGCEGVNAVIFDSLLVKLEKLCLLDSTCTCWRDLTQSFSSLRHITLDSRTPILYLAPRLMRVKSVRLRFSNMNFLYAFGRFLSEYRGEIGVESISMITHSRDYFNPMPPVGEVGIARGLCKIKAVELDLFRLPSRVEQTLYAMVLEGTADLVHLSLWRKVPHLRENLQSDLNLMGNAVLRLRSFKASVSLNQARHILDRIYDTDEMNLQVLVLLVKSSISTFIYPVDKLLIIKKKLRSYTLQLATQFSV